MPPPQSITDPKNRWSVKLFMTWFHELRIFINFWTNQSIHLIFNFVLFVKCQYIICLRVQICKSYKSNCMWPRCGLGSKYVLHMHTAKTLKKYVHMFDFNFYLFTSALSLWYLYRAGGTWGVQGKISPPRPTI